MPRKCAHSDIFRFVLRLEFDSKLYPTTVLVSKKTSFPWRLFWTLRIPASVTKNRHLQGDCVYVNISIQITNVTVFTRGCIKITSRFFFCHATTHRFTTFYASIKLTRLFKTILVKFLRFPALLRRYFHLDLVWWVPSKEGITRESW